jgi:hypothetical protein
MKKIGLSIPILMLILTGCAEGSEKKPDGTTCLIWTGAFMLPIQCGDGTPITKPSN